MTNNPLHPNIIFVLTDGQGYGDLSCSCRSSVAAVAALPGPRTVQPAGRPKQQQDVAQANPDIVKRLQGFYET